MMKRRLLISILCLLVICLVIPIAQATLEPHVHNWVLNERESVAPTCGKEGKNVYRCQLSSPADYCDAGGRKEETVPATGNHTWVLSEKESVAPTCTGNGKNVYVCSVCGQKKEETVKATGHTEELSSKDCVAPGCESNGKNVYRCKVCGEITRTETVSATGHSWGAWTTTKEATCAQGGSQTRTCTVCGKMDTVGTNKNNNHKWSGWAVIKEATCTENGKQEHKCTVCGKKESLTIKKLGHEAGEWTVTKEPTCQKEGSRESTCIRCGKKMTEKLKKVGHEYEEWETVTEATDFSKGKRQAVCRFCKRKKTEEFYPDGTLASDLENDEDSVKAMQTELAVLGYHKGKITGVFDKTTVASVKKAEKSWGLKQDGVAWPGFLKMLGVKGSGGEGITKDPSKYTLQLDVVQTSPKKDYYVMGEEITYQWTLTNASKKQTSKNTKVYHFNGEKANKSTDEVIEDVGSLKAGESVSGTFTYVVSKDDMITEIFRHGFIARGKIGSDSASSNQVHFVNSTADGIGGPGEESGGIGSGGWTPPSEEAITITKKVEGTPKNGSFYTEDEKITFRITLKNKTANHVDDVILTDELFGSGWKKTFTQLKGNETKVIDVDYTVTSKDAGDFIVNNTAVVSYLEGGKTKMSKASTSAPTGFSTDEIHVFKTCTSTPANGLFYVPGEKVDFEIKLVNPTATTTFESLRIYDKLYSSSIPYKTKDKLIPSETVVYTYSTTVTYLQANLGSLTNKVTVSYREPPKKDRLSQSNECTVPCGFDGEEGIIVTKTVISTPNNGLYYDLGEEIRYEINVVNNTVKDITDMDIRDNLMEMDTNGYRTVQKGETLKAGETYTIHFSYIVGPGDVKDTKVVNIASAWWTMNGIDYIETFSEPVIVPCAPKMENVKPEVENLEGDACTPTLTGSGDGVTQRDLTECEEHTVTAQDAEKLIEEGNYEGAIELWDGEIDEMYKEWEESASGEEQRIAENEEAAYDHQMSALSESLALVCGSSDVQAILTEERMEKCVELCYELHTAPEDRPDSVTGVHTELLKDETGSECSRDVSYTAAGPARLVDDQCETHTTTTKLSQALLNAVEDDEDKANMWIRIQNNWLLELNLMYDTWYLSADEDERTKIAADRISFDELISARRDALAILYPDDPATAEEVLANMIMHRAELICYVLHEAGVLTD